MSSLKIIETTSMQSKKHFLEKFIAFLQFFVEGFGWDKVIKQILCQV